MALHWLRCSSVTTIAALLTILIPTFSLAATVPKRLCGPGRPLSLSDPICNASVRNTRLTTPSENLIPMPGSGSETENIFPFHMTHSPLGVIFTDYDPILPIPNYIIDQLLARATGILSAAIARNPAVENEPIPRVAKWTHPADEIVLFIEPEYPDMNYGHLYSLFGLLEEWARVYRAEECSLEIWAWPGMSSQTKLGMGHIVKDPDWGFKAANRSETG